LLRSGADIKGVSADVEGAAAASGPIGLLDIDVAAPLPDSWSTGTRYARARVLVRRGTRALGLLDVQTPNGVLTRADVLQAAGRAFPEALSPEAVEEHARAESRVLARASAPSASVILCTRGRPEYLSACVRSLLRIDYPAVEVVVVDNGSPEDDVPGLIADLHAEHPDRDIRVIAEPTPGLSFARNTGLRAAKGSFIAFTDDDAVVDPDWLSELWHAVASVPGAAAATGLVLPAELETEAQVLFEEFGGHSKGRAFARQIIDPLQAGCQHPLYPLPAFGAGVNMAFRVEALDEIGGFDPALGAGSPAGGSEDTAVFSQVLLNGHSLVFTPDAIVRHYHRPDFAALERQLAGYGRGLTAYYTKMVLERPRLILELARLAPTALHDLLNSDSVRNEGLSKEFPPELTKAQIRGMLEGPRAYLRGRRAVRRRGFRTAA
jgi:glycosyltransferase involved in cell wall biosynthesis